MSAIDSIIKSFKTVSIKFPFNTTCSLAPHIFWIGFIACQFTQLKKTTTLTLVLCETKIHFHKTISQSECVGFWRWSIVQMHQIESENMFTWNRVANIYSFVHTCKRFVHTCCGWHKASVYLNTVFLIEIQVKVYALPIK